MSFCSFFFWRFARALSFFGATLLDIELLIVRQLRETGRKLIKGLQEAEVNCAKAKAAYEMQRKMQDKSQEEYEKASFNNAQSPAVEKVSASLLVLLTFFFFE